MNLAALPLLFNGLFFSISPTVVHNTPVVPGKETVVMTYHQTSNETDVHYPCNPAAGTMQCTPNTKTVKVQVSFKLNDKKEVEVISVTGSAPNLNAAIMQNLGSWMPSVKSYLMINKTYSFTVEICDKQMCG